MPFANAASNITFRRYQRDMLKVFEQALGKNDRKFHLVAPPGSGKTLIGLEMMRRLGQPAVVFSPNQAIQSGWLSQLEAFSFDLTGSADHDSAADLLSLTYQSISVKERGRTELHANARELIGRIRQRGTIILDECHHLTDYWAAVLLEAIAPHQYMIALTATPPRDKTPGEWENYLKLLGPIDYEIILPPVIKEGFLAPYQDLVYVVSPNAEEVEWINRICRPYQEVMQKLLTTTDCQPVHFWAQNSLEEPVDEQGIALPFDDALKYRFSFMVALVRFVKKHLLDIPPAVFLVPEMDDPLTFEDVLIIITEYVKDVLGKSRSGEVLFLELKEALKEIGYKLTKRGLSLLPGGIKEIISLSQSKITALKPLIEKELMEMQDELRLLVLTDFESSEGREGTSAREVMRFITSCPEIDKVDPVLVTGRSLLVDDDLVDIFMEFARGYFRDRSLNCSLEKIERAGFYEILGKGTDWNTRVYVGLVSLMLEYGITRCLISTRNLLGEGWNSERLNTLIDLTVVASYAFVNQVRGRTLRLNPDRPFKTANNWDIVAVLDNPIEGDYDLKRVQKKYNCFYGLSGDDVIEAGIGHVHPVFCTNDTGLILKHLDRLNTDMMERCRERLKAFKRWKIGKQFKNDFTECVEIIPLDEEKEPAFRPNENHLKKKLQIMVRAGKVVRSLAYASWIMLGGGFLFSGMLTGAWPVLAVSGLAAWVMGKNHGTFLLSPLMKQITLYGCEQPESLYCRIKDLTRVLFYTMKKLKLCETSLSEKNIRIIKREDGRYRIFLEGSKSSQPFSTALQELLAPVQDQKYFVYEQYISRVFVKQFWDEKYKAVLKDKYKSSTGFIKGSVVVYPVPELFTRNKDTRHTFLSFWRQYICPSEILTSSEIVESQIRVRPLPVISKEKRIWM